MAGTLSGDDTNDEQIISILRLHPEEAGKGHVDLFAKSFSVVRKFRNQREFFRCLSATFTPMF